MTGTLPAGRVTVSVGTPQNLARSENQKISIREFASWFEKPLVTKEKYRDFKNASFKKKQQLKASAGWFIRCPIDGGIRNRKSVLPSQLITYDLDNVPAEMVESVLSGDVLPGIAFVVHSTRSHTPESPRLRLSLFVEESVKPEDYNRVSRIVGLLIDPKLEHIDPVSFRPAQMMFLPSVSSDMLKHYIFHTQGGAKLDWRAEVEAWEQFNGDSHDVRNLPKAASEPTLREVAEEAEDPLEKKGPVGDFCRAWTITELVMGKEDEDGNHVEGPLKDIYEIDDWEHGAAARMTYVHGHSTNGAVVYEDKFVYSHHGSDPASDQLLNAYDLVRVHLFGDQDEKIDEDTPMKDRPSVKSMKDWLSDDPFYREQQAESRYDLAAKFLDDADAVDDDDEEGEGEEDDEDDDLPSADDLLGVPLASVVQQENSVSRRLKVEKPPKRWIAKELDLGDDGVIKSTSFNVTTIVSNDPRLWRKIAFNRFSREVVLLLPITTKAKLIPDIDCLDRINGDRWQDVFDLTIKAIIEAPAGKGKPGYGIKVGKEMVADSIRLAAQNNSFHPLLDYLESVRGIEPDQELVETFWVRHAGVEDNPYTREATLLMGIASVARLFEPGHKWDHAIIFEGPQGIGKSTAVKRLYGAFYFGELHADLKDEKKCAEAMMGKWVLELPELSALHKSDHNDAKAFITRQDDDVRLSYDRHVSRLPRQCVFFGTSNDSEYLRDPTGNRRFWPMVCADRPIDLAGILAERDAFWATCLHIYLSMRQRHPSGDLPLMLSGKAEKIARKMQESRRKREMWESWHESLMDWMEEPILLRQLANELGIDELDTDFRGYNTDSTWVRRVAFSQDAAFSAVVGSFGKLPSNNVVDLAWKRVLAKCEEDGWKREKCRIGGIQRRWIVHPEADEFDRRLGFWVDSSPNGQAESGPRVDKDDDGLI